MMSNPKTTIPGVLLIVAAVAQIAAHAWQGALSMSDLAALVAALGGFGLIGAKDGEDGKVIKALRRKAKTFLMIRRVNRPLPMLLLVVLVGSLGGCSTIAVTCPDGKSTANWKGAALFGNSSVSCSSTATGVTASVSGMDVVAIAQAVMPMVAPLVAQQQKLLASQAPAPGPTPANGGAK